MKNLQFKSDEKPLVFIKEPFDIAEKFMKQAKFKKTKHGMEYVFKKPKQKIQ